MMAPAEQTSLVEKYRREQRDKIDLEGAICGHCEQKIPRGQGFLYAHQSLGDRIIRACESGPLLLCVRCSRCVTPLGLFYARRDEPLEMEVTFDDLRESNSRWTRALFSNVAGLCREKGLAPWQARREARKLAEAFWAEPFDARLAAMSYWGA